jgi:hypothetical protein
MTGVISPDFWWGIGIATAIAIAAALRMKLFRSDEYRQMTWMDWCGHFALIGIAVILVGGLAGFKAVTAAGVILLVGLYPIAILGLLGRFDEMISEIIRAIRRR